MMSLAMTDKPLTALQMQQELSKLRMLHHSNCLFLKNPPVDDLMFEFQPDGALRGTSTFKDIHQGYENKVHGGLVASIIDASMTQCLMGHGVVAYTTELLIRYREPVNLGENTVFVTRIVNEKRGVLYTMQCTVEQGAHIKVRAAGKFLRAADKEVAVNEGHT